MLLAAHQFAHLVLLRIHLSGGPELRILSVGAHLMGVCVHAKRGVHI